MKLQILGSDSSGNCYILKGEKESLVLECGVRFSEFKKQTNFVLHNLKSVLISHFHFDHSGYWRDFHNSGVPVYASVETAKQLDFEKEFNTNIFTNIKPFSVSNFKILPFDVPHDGVPCSA